MLDSAQDAHRLELDELLERFQTDIYLGLSEKEARQRASTKGNILQRIVKDKFINRAIKEVSLLFHLVLLLAALLSFIAYGLSSHHSHFVTSQLLSPSPPPPTRS